MQRQAPTRQLILEAAIACIEKYGLEKVTTRRIAEQAGTNLASINYHFRSKDELIAETMSLTSRHMLEDVMLELANTHRPFRATLRAVFKYLLEGSSRFPGMTRAHLSQAVFDGRRDSVGGQAMYKVFRGLLERAVRAYPRKDRRLLQRRLAQVMYSIMFIVLAPDFFERSSQARQSREQRARHHADSFAELFLRGI